MATKFDVTGEQHFSITGQMLEIQRQLRLKSGSPLDPEKLKTALQNIIENKFEKAKESDGRLLRVISQTPYVKLISENTEIILDATDGSKFISEAKSTFKSGIDPDFKNYGLAKKGKKTAKTPVDVYEITRDGTSKEIFKSFNTNLDKLVMTQHQIIDFCEKHPFWLNKNGCSNLFLTKKGRNYFVVSVDVYSDVLYVYVYRFVNDSVWNAKFQLRIVVPQLIES